MNIRLTRRDEYLAEADKHIAKLDPDLHPPALESNAHALAAIALLLRAGHEPEIVTVPADEPATPAEHEAVVPIHYSRASGPVCGAEPPDSGLGIPVVSGNDAWPLVTCLDCIHTRMTWIHAWRSADRGGRVVTGCRINLLGTHMQVTGNPSLLTCPDCKAGYAAETGRRPAAWES
jgi:hypothetical protein